MCLEVEVIDEVEIVHGKDHSYEVTKSFSVVLRMLYACLQNPHMRGKYPSISVSVNLDPRALLLTEGEKSSGEL